MYDLGKDEVIEVDEAIQRRELLLAKLISGSRLDTLRGFLSRDFVGCGCWRSCAWFSFRVLEHCALRCFVPNVSKSSMLDSDQYTGLGYIRDETSLVSRTVGHDRAYPCPPIASRRFTHDLNIYVQSHEELRGGSKRNHGESLGRFSIRYECTYDETYNGCRIIARLFSLRMLCCRRFPCIWQIICPIRNRTVILIAVLT